MRIMRNCAADYFEEEKHDTCAAEMPARESDDTGKFGTSFAGKPRAPLSNLFPDGKRQRNADCRAHPWGFQGQGDINPARLRT